MSFFFYSPHCLNSQRSTRLSNKSHINAEVNEKLDRVKLQLINYDTIYLTKHIFLQSISLPRAVSQLRYENPSATQVFHKLLEIGHNAPLETTSNFKKSKLPVTWNFLVYLIIRCLTRKTGGTNQLNIAWLQIFLGIVTGRPIDYATCICNDFKEYIGTKKMKIHHARFWVVCLESFYNASKIPFDESLEIFETRQTKRFSLPDQVDFRATKCLPTTLLDLIP